MSQSSFNREIGRLFQSAIEESFYSSAEAEVHNAEVSSTIHGEFREFVLLTITSPLFRVLTVIHLNNDQATRSFVASKLNTSVEALADDRFYDYIGEVGNTLCGSIKRSLNTHIPSLGMSTPNRLVAGSMKYMLSQKPSFETYQHIEINGQTLFECGVYVCNDVELEFDITTTTKSNAEVEEADCGELEFF